MKGQEPVVQVLFFFEFRTYQFIFSSVDDRNNVQYRIPTAYHLTYCSCTSRLLPKIKSQFHFSFLFKFHSLYAYVILLVIKEMMKQTNIKARRKTKNRLHILITMEKGRM